MMTREAAKSREQLEIISLDELVPKDHLVRKIEAAIDWSFIYELVEPLYCDDNGWPSLNPVTLIKLPVLQYMFGIRSMRRTVQEVQTDAAYRWFLGLGWQDAVPHFTTFSKNYTRRFKDTDLFEQIFQKILAECFAEKMVDPSLMVYFRKRLTPEILGEINEIIVSAARKGEPRHDDDDGRGNGGNRGTMIVDATCAPSNIRYPQDASLLNEAREDTEKLLDELHDPACGRKPRTYRAQAHRDFLQFSRSRKKTVKKIRKAVGKQLRYLARNLAAIEEKLALGRTLSERKGARLAVIRILYEQQKYMYDHRCHTVPDRIVSVSQPFLRPIVRGKAGKPVEFGAKLDISVVNGWTRLECFSFDAYNEAGNLAAMAEWFRERESHYPSRILADNIYRNRENLRYCKEHGIHLYGPALGRPKKDEIRNKTQDFLDECERVEVERRFSLAKRKCGLGLIVTKLRQTIAHSVAMSILVLNLRKIQCALLWLLALLVFWMPPQKKCPLFS